MAAQRSDNLYQPTKVFFYLFGWLSMANIDALFYVIPKLCRNQLAFPKLATYLDFFWNAIVLVGSVALAMVQIILQMNQSLTIHLRNSKNKQKHTL